ncbi:MAG: hypothetical protein R2712_00725 [Vicinamibacterales bacterium]
MTRLVVAAWVVGAAAVLAPPRGSTAQPSAERALTDLVDAPDSATAMAAVDRVVASGVSIETAVERLRAGRRYPEPGRSPVTMRFTASDKTPLEAVVELPAAYTPARRWPLRVQLHGGVGRPENADPRPLTPNRLPGEEAIYVQPRAHARAEWWHLNQYEHIVSLLDRLKRAYNIDENLVYMTGVSDGATGAYFYAMKLATPFSAFLPLNGNMRVLATPGTRANGQLYAGNMVNTPFFVINGGRDPLYPAASVEPHLRMLQDAGATVEYRPQPEAGHDTRWWPNERAAFEQFVRAHPREPHPATLSWETERTDHYNRVRWLVITGLGRRPGDDAGLEDVNRFAGETPGQRMYARMYPSGRVDVARRGNSYEARTRGVTTFSLLLSPDVIDFAQPVTVRVNGAVVFNALVEQDLRTLITWAAQDADRTMLYTAALQIRVP